MANKVVILSTKELFAWCFLLGWQHIEQTIFFPIWSTFKRGLIADEAYQFFGGLILATI